VAVIEGWLSSTEVTPRVSGAGSWQAKAKTVAIVSVFRAGVAR